MKIKYKLFKFWKNRQYRKFLKESNWEFDHSSITNFLELKLTIMGLYFAKFGIVIDDDRKKQVHTIWQTRKYLRNYQNAFDIVEEQCQKKFVEKYGCRYECELTTDDHYLCINCSSKIENKEEAKAYWNSLDEFKLEYEYQQDQLKKVFDSMQNNMMTWWD